MSPTPSPFAVEAITAFRGQLAILITIQRDNSSTSDPRFIKWRSTTTEIFKRFLPNSDYFSGFSAISFEPGLFDVPSLPSDPHSRFKIACNEARAYLEAAIEHIHKFGLASPNQQPEAVDRTAVVNLGVLVLISHSAKDKNLAEALINLLRAGLNLSAKQIRCTSVDGYRLPAGVNTNDQLRREIRAVKVLIGLLTPNSLASTYVLFELGARWGAGLFMIPLLAGIGTEEMRGPQNVLNALSCETESQLIQLVEDVGRELKTEPESAAGYHKQLEELKKLSETIIGSSVVNGGANRQPDPEPAKSLRISITAEGKPPSQVFKVTANQPVIVTRLEYMLADETCIVGREISLRGESVEVPLDQADLTKLMNTPRPDMSSYDHSGPVKFGLTISSRRGPRQYIVPARLEDEKQSGTVNYHRLVTGSKQFFEDS